MTHQPALTEAFHGGPLQAWRDSYAQMYAQAVERGELPADVDTSMASEASSALLAQRWLLTGDPVTHEYADQVLDAVVLPVLRSQLG